MSEQVCPACEKNSFDECELVDVAIQHKLYAPNSQEMQRDLTAAALETTSTYQMLKCRKCGLEFCNPLSAPSAEWYKLAYRAKDLYSQKRWEYDEVLRRINKGARAFEFGCGSGLFLMRCKEHGVSASGMDFSQDGVASCVANGLDVRQIALEGIATVADSERTPQLMAFHFLEHLDKPLSLFQQAAARALPSAHLWISVPSDRRPTRQFEVTDFLDQPPHHMTRWTAEAFQKIGERSGWRLVEVLYEPMPLRSELWWIATNSPTYRRWKASGRFEKPVVEKMFRSLTLPVALMRRLWKHRHLSGFAMMAHFIVGD